MLKSLIIFVSLISIAISCKSESIDPETEKPTPMVDDTEKKLTYLALGDSYTIGQGVGDDERFPAQLKDTLEKSGIVLEKVQIIARTGWTTDELTNGINSAELDPSYSFVTLLIGVNNQYRGLSAESYRPEFVGLLSRAIALAGGDKSRVVVLSIPDWGVTPFALGRNKNKISAEIDAFNAINRQESEKLGVAWVDVTTISRQAAYRPELIAADNLHPSGAMYRYWVQYLYPLVFEMLKED